MKGHQFLIVTLIIIPFSTQSIDSSRVLKLTGKTIKASAFKEDNSLFHQKFYPRIALKRNEFKNSKVLFNNSKKSAGISSKTSTQSWFGVIQYFNVTIGTPGEGFNLGFFFWLLNSFFSTNI